MSKTKQERAHRQMICKRLDIAAQLMPWFLGFLSDGAEAIDFRCVETAAAKAIGAADALIREALVDIPDWNDEEEEEESPGPID
jgi:hypothetical protein